MTLTQLKVALLTARGGSISAAAREMEIPQPNASNALKTLEKELNFDIFTRSINGIEPTPKGSAFLLHAEKILKEQARINELSAIGNVSRLRIGCTNYYLGKEAFIRFCAEHQEDLTAELSYCNVSINAGIPLLEDHSIDIVLGPVVDTLLSTYSEMSEEKRLICLDLGETCPVITLRKDHPIVKDGLFDKKVDIDLLNHYPYAAYLSLSGDFNTPVYEAVFKPPCKYTLYVDEKETRLKIVSTSDAFQLGVVHSKKELDHYGLVEYPYPGYRMKVLCFFRKGEEETPEILHFLELIREIQETEKK